MKVKITIPETLDGITLKQYQEYEQVLKQFEDKENKDFVAMKMVSIFGNVPMEDLRKVDIAKYQVAVDMINALFEQKVDFKQIIEVHGEKFGFIPNLEEMTLGEYVDLEAYIKEAKDWHKAMAVMYRPVTMQVKDTYQIEEYKSAEKYEHLMKEASFADAYGALLFFWALGKELLNASMTYLTEGSQTTNTENEQGSPSDGDGINLSTISRAVMLLESTLLRNYRFTPASLN